MSQNYECKIGTSCFTLTFSESVENHTKMQIIGNKAANGFTPDECRELAQKFNGELIDLNSLLPEGVQADDAPIVVFRNGLQTIFNVDPTAIFNEHAQLNMDKKCFMYGRVVNKHARWNLCFAEQHQLPDYENKKGTIYSFDELPLTNKLRGELAQFGENFTNLYAEGNYYYDVKKCFIGWHGDTERKKVVGIRLGTVFPLHYRWYQNAKPTSHQVTINLQPGDVYIMSEKATGQDWKRRKIEWTLRHSAGEFKHLD